MQSSVKEDRELYIGGSDIGTIMGISPFSNRYDLLLFKAGIQSSDFDGNIYTDYGNLMEPKIREYINKSKRTKFIETKHINGNKRCHLDGENKTTVLEIKTTSTIRKKVDSYKLYLVQLLFYMSETKKKKGILAVYNRPKDFNEVFDKNRLQLFTINIKDYDELIKDIYYEIDRFEKDLERLKKNPLLSEKDFER